MSELRTGALPPVTAVSLAAFGPQPLLEGQGVLISGGSGGIGRATARIAAAHGAAVCIGYRTHPERAAAVVDEICAAGRRAVAVQADVSREEDILRMFEFADRELGRVTGLVNSAAMVGQQARVDLLDAAQLAALWTTNISGYFLCCREAVKRMSTVHGGLGGSIVNVSSLSGRSGGRGHRVAYAATKGAINTLTIGLGREVATEGIRVNAVLPGFIDTEFHDAFGREARVRAISPQITMKRAGRPEEVAEAIVWLLSSKASFVTATLLDVAGGD